MLQKMDMWILDGFFQVIADGVNMLWKEIDCFVLARTAFLIMIVLMMIITIEDEGVLDEDILNPECVMSIIVALVYICFDMFLAKPIMEELRNVLKNNTKQNPLRSSTSILRLIFTAQACSFCILSTQNLSAWEIVREITIVSYFYFISCNPSLPPSATKEVKNTV